MEMQICPNCGRQVGKGDRFCGYCRYPIGAVQTKLTFGDGIREGIVPAAGSWIGAVAGAILWLLLSAWLMGYIMGSAPADAIVRGLVILLPYILFMPLVGAGIDLLLHGCCANSRVGQVLCTLGTMLALCFSGVFLAVFAPGIVSFGRVSPEIFQLTLQCVRGILPTLPLLQGALFCGGSKGQGRKAILRQLLILAVFLLLQILIAWVTVMVFALGMTGFFLAALAGGILTVLAALLTRRFGK